MPLVSILILIIDIFKYLLHDVKVFFRMQIVRLVICHRNSPNTLVAYLRAIAVEMGVREYKWENNWSVIQKYSEQLKNLDTGRPSWMYGAEFDKVIITHRANLYLKAPDLYPQYKSAVDIYRPMVCCADCNYYWPTHVRNK